MAVFVCICNAIKEGELAKVCCQSDVARAEDAMARLDCRPSCGKCLCQIDEMIMDSAHRAAPHIAVAMQPA